MVKLAFILLSVLMKKWYEAEKAKVLNPQITYNVERECMRVTIRAKDVRYS